MNELLTLRAWTKSLDFSGWEGAEAESLDVEDEQLRWLALRDAPAFDRQWMRVFALVETQENGRLHGQNETALISEIRKIGFSKAREVALANELADYAADDFDLLARAAWVGVSDFWLQKLKTEYTAGRFPCGAL